MPNESVPAPPAFTYLVVDEVLNYGGFFGGDAVTLYAHPPDAPDADRQYIIAEHNFQNLKDGDRYKVQESQVLGLVLDGGEVRAARLVGAPDRAALLAATEPAPPRPGHELEPRALAYRCAHCALWLVDTPPRDDAGVYRCEICGRPLIDDSKG